MVALQGGGMVPTKKPNPQEQINAMLASMGALDSPDGLKYGWDGGGGADTTDYYAQAQQMYAPQFGYLDEAARTSKANATESGGKLKSLYDSLVNQIAGQEKGIKTNYDQGIAGVGGAYNSALGNVDAAYDSSRNGVAETLQRLGIQEAGANTTAKQSQQQALMQSILSANKMAGVNALQQGKQSAITYNTQQKGAAGMAGAEAQTGLKKQLGDFLNQIAMQRAQLGTQVNQSAMGMQSDAQKSAYEQFRDSRDFNYKVAQDKANLDLGYAKLAGDGPTGNQKIDPLGQVNQLATQLYGGNTQAAGNAVKAITDAIAREPELADGEFSYGELIAQVYDRLKKANGGVGDQGNLNQIAALLYQQMYGK